jgi:hypothetical protein
LVDLSLSLSLSLVTVSTVYRYFQIGFTQDICRSLAFDLVNYLGQLLIFHLFSSPSSAATSPPYTTKQKPRPEDTTERTGSQEEAVQEVTNRKMVLTMQRETRRRKKKNWVVMSVLTWLLISLLDGLASFVLERWLSVRILADVAAYERKLQLDQYFLLQP